MPPEVVQKATGPSKVFTARLEELQRGELRLEEVTLVFSQPLVAFHLEDRVVLCGVLADQPVECRRRRLLSFGTSAPEVGDPDVCVR